jgi:hypothetical protein
MANLSGLKVQAGLKAGGFSLSNHNAQVLRVKSGLKAGGMKIHNHNAPLVRIVKLVGR